MLPIKDMQFMDTKYARRTVVKGMCRFTSVAQIENENLVAGLIEGVKHRMRRELWQKMYGDLMTPFHELAIVTLKYASEVESRHAQELVKQIEALLTMPKE